ncbi:MAG: hypothetical protein P8P74_12975 [Crocinitomicaceae bacterium]|nr:hypothetical protein [Crocinitomicaceae bacterium]
MRKLLLTLFISSSLYSTAQFIGGEISYYNDQPSSFPWTTNNGIMLGLGVESENFYESPLTYSIRYIGLFNLARDGKRLENIEFDLPDSVTNRTGYADVKFKKMSFGLEYDMGYKEEWSFVEPYASIGGRFSFHSAWATYALYEEEPCYCSNVPEEISETASLGFSSGIGVKFHVEEVVIFDLRATYYGTWGLRRNEFSGTPDPDSFHIDPYGVPTFDYNSRNYFGGFEFRVGVKIKIGAGLLSGLGDYSDDSDYSDDGDTDSNQSVGSGGKTCELLSPAGRGL